MKLSIIIPMYNAERYIGNCLDSILNSDLPKDCYEVIVINDGSKDKGPKIAQEYANGHENFVYLTQENQGQSVARNYGIREARGEYVWFVDADDELHKELGFLLSMVEQYNKPDLLSFRLEARSFPDKDFLHFGSSHQQVPHNQVISGRDAVMAGYMPSSVCTFIIKRSLLIGESLTFYPGIVHQDVEMSYRMVSLAKSVVFTDYCLYIYYIYNNSTIHTTNLRKQKRMLIDDSTIAHSFKQFAEKMQPTDKELSDKIFAHSQSMVLGILMTMLKNRKVWRKEKYNEEILTALKEKSLFPIRNKNLSLKQQMMRLIMNQKWIYS